MRILIAYDGSPGADIAAQLVAGVAWPPGSVIDLVHAVATGPTSATSLEPNTQATRAPRRTAVIAAEEASQQAERWLRALPNASFNLRYGRAAAVITDEASAVGADLIVMGSRGRGPYATLLLGSVATDVVDAAPCPVMVARLTTVERVVLATDGSPPAELAAATVANWPMFAGPHISVVTVGDSLGHAPHAVGPIDPGADPARIAARAARTLRRAGRHARATFRVGNPSEQIRDLVKRRHVDLVVLGSRRHTGLARVTQGSVAREVLLGTDASVLICPVRSAEPPGAG